MSETVALPAQAQWATGRVDDRDTVLHRSPSGWSDLSGQRMSVADVDQLAPAHLVTGHDRSEAFRAYFSNDQVLVFGNQGELIFSLPTGQAEELCGEIMRAAWSRRRLVHCEVHRP